VKKRDDAFNSYCDSELKLTEKVSNQSTRTSRDYIPEKKEVSIASASIKQNNLIMKKMMYTSAKSETKKYNRYYQEDMDRTRMEKLLVKYD